jgi:hypothetical protein
MGGKAREAAGEAEAAARAARAAAGAAQGVTSELRSAFCAAEAALNKARQLAAWAQPVAPGAMRDAALAQLSQEDIELVHEGVRITQPSDLIREVAAAIIVLERLIDPKYVGRTEQLDTLNRSTSHTSHAAKHAHYSPDLGVLLNAAVRTGFCSKEGLREWWRVRTMACVCVVCCVLCCFCAVCGCF